MKLTDLEPRWIQPHGFSPTVPFYIGVSFQSPKTGNRIAVLFTPFIDPAGDAERWGWDTETWYPGQPRWRRTGHTFDTLTLEPSLNFEPHDWHGSIAAGLLVNA